MDRDYGSKPGSGGVASAQQQNIDRRDRLRQLALQTLDISKDPYLLRNHLGSYECKLCLTLHNNEGNYLAHTQGKRHQENVGRRLAREARDNPVLPLARTKKVHTRKTVKIGRPGYRVTKQIEPDTQQRSLLFQASAAAGPGRWVHVFELRCAACSGARVRCGARPLRATLAWPPCSARPHAVRVIGRSRPTHVRAPRANPPRPQVEYPEIEEGLQPRHRFMSAYEQKVDAPDKDFQYVLFAAEPLRARSRPWRRQRSPCRTDAWRGGC